MDVHDRDYIAAVINYFWGPNLTTPQSINESAAVVAYGALEQTNICSDSMDLVPRPMGVPSSTYAIKQLAKIGKRILSGVTSIYNTCKVKVGVNFKSEIVMALRGI